jgi:hypothetical protein
VLEHSMLTTLTHWIWSFLGYTTSLLTCIICVFCGRRWSSYDGIFLEFSWCWRARIRNTLFRHTHFGHTLMCTTCKRLIWAIRLRKFALRGLLWCIKHFNFYTWILFYLVFRAQCNDVAICLWSLVNIDPLFVYFLLKYSRLNCEKMSWYLFL